MNDVDARKKRLFRLATDSYRKSDEKLWVTAFACGKVVGNYDRGATMGLASDMSVSSDTVEDLAHAYWIYDDLCRMDGGAYRDVVRKARRAPYIYYSHFRALYDAKQAYHLTLKQVMDLLMDIIQGEGTISSRGVDGHTRGRFGDTRGWTFYAARALKELNLLNQQPDLPNLVEGVGSLYILSFVSKIDNSRQVKFFVVAHNEQRAENIGRKDLVTQHLWDDEEAKKAICTQNALLGPVRTDSKHLLNTASSWLGDKA